jgi:hypothetical protein
MNNRILKTGMGAEMWKSSSLLFIALFSCSATSYRYYDLKLEQGARGELIHSDPKLNKDLVETCFPKSKCVVLEQETWFRLIRDYREVKKKLDSCERR